MTKKSYKMSLLEEAEVRQSVTENPEGVNADAVVSVMNMLRSDKSDWKEYTDVNALLEDLGLGEFK